MSAGDVGEVALTKATILYSDRETNTRMLVVCERAEWFSIRQYFNDGNWMVDYEILHRIERTAHGQ
jgi:hypothetical protein